MTHKDIFYNLLSRKTGWGRNEIKKLYEEAEIQARGSVSPTFNNNTTLEKIIIDLGRKVDILFDSKREESSEETDDPPW